MHICVNGLEAARAALVASSPAGGEREQAAHAEQPIHLISPPYAACHAGVGYYQAMLRQLRDEFPEVRFTFTLCCGDDPAVAYDALRAGFDSIVYEGSEAGVGELNAIGEAMRALVHRLYPPTPSS